MMRSRHLFTLLCLLALAACGQRQPSGPTAAIYKVGEPYQIDGTWYYPHEDYSYDQTGIASWYGQDFHGQRTANGEIFNKDELTAAHKTLPLPTLARVTNLENGKSIVVRINDRGPFSGSRLIDLSQRGAHLLGFEQQGTAKVRVQVLADESKAIADAMRHYGTEPTRAAPTYVASSGPMPVVNAAPLTPVSAVALDSPSPESAELQPVKTTPAVHQALLKTQPVQEVEQLPVTGANQIYVQAGAFSRVENANALKQKLARYGKASVTQAVVNGQKFYRVRVGPIADVQHADAVIGKINQTGAAKSRIVIE
jgi:rare lipoprotein A